MIKIISSNDNLIVDLVKSPYYTRFLPSGRIAITDWSSAQGIVGSDNKTVYSFSPIQGKDYKVVTIEKVTKDEFSRLQSLLNSGEKLFANTDKLISARTNKLTELSTTCKNKITSGFTITLSDKQLHSFRLTPEDQLNLLNIENQMLSGVESFIYHSTDRPCQIFSHYDMCKIIAAFRRHTLYHTTYFNVAKQYINSLEDIEQINSFTYGTDISYIVDDTTLKQILKDGSTFA